MGKRATPDRSKANYLKSMRGVLAERLAELRADPPVDDLEVAAAVDAAADASGLALRWAVVPVARRRGGGRPELSVHDRKLDAALEARRLDRLGGSHVVKPSADSAASDKVKAWQLCEQAFGQVLALSRRRRR